MTVAVAEKDTRLERFEELHRTLPADAPPPLRKLRSEAFARFAELGFPHPEIEEWRLTNIAPILRTDFAHPAAGTRPDLSGISLPSAAAEIVVVGGRIDHALSRNSGLPKGVRAISLALGMAAGDPVAARLGSLVGAGQHFAALNAALLTDGVIVHVGPGLVLREPIHVIFAGVDGGLPTVASPRLFVVAEPNSQVTIVESYTGTGRYLTNAVTEIHAGDGAVVDHYKLQRESTEAFHVSNTHILQERSSSVRTHSVSFGGALTRNDLQVVLSGEGASCVLDGLYLLEGTQHVDNHTVIDHATPHAESLELYKGILDDKSRGVFDGKIIVRPGAQKTASRQTNKNLLLSNDAVADSNPTLEIYADDVKCNHGSTIGQLDEEALFYLQSRGIGAAEAKNILTLAFASEIVERMDVEEIRVLLEQLLLARLPQSKGVRG